MTVRVNEFLNKQQQDTYASGRKETMLNGGDKLGGRGDKTRTYNYIHSRVVDHRLGRKTSNLKEIMKGHFEILFESQEEAQEDE